MAFTFFFRDRHTLELVAKLTQEFTKGFSKIKVWNAGSAMGPEPYTFAIILSELLGPYDYKKVSISASDIDDRDMYGKIINEAIYPLNELERMPEGILEKYFEKTDDLNRFKIVDSIRNSMTFTKHDLLTLEPFDTNFHVVICKNVLLHFHYEQRIEVIKMFHHCLEPGGFLVNEQTQQMPTECAHLFEKAVPDANIYRKI